VIREFVQSKEKREKILRKLLLSTKTKLKVGAYEMRWSVRKFTERGPWAKIVFTSPGLRPGDDILDLSELEICHRGYEFR
jgi:hypothetical protein